MAKGLGGGFPIGAIWVSEKFCNIFKHGSQGTTFGGSPLACSAANAVLDVIENENLINKAEENGAFLYSELNKLAVKYSDLIEQVRGKGLMLAIELKNETGRLIEILRENRLLVVGAAGNTIRYLPPLNINKKEISEAVEITSLALKKFQKEKLK